MGSRGRKGLGLSCSGHPPQSPHTQSFTAAGTRDQAHGGHFFQGTVWGGGLWDDSSVLYSLGTLFLLLPRQLHRRSPGIRPLTLGTPG